VTATNQFDDMSGFQCVAVYGRIDAGKPSLLDRVSPASVVLIPQLAYFVLRVAAGRFTNNAAALASLTYLGVALAAVGIGAGAYICRVGNRGRGLHCAVASMAMAFFCYLQLRMILDFS